jgi:hypothetical protein
MSAKITITIEVNEKRAEYTQFIDREFSGEESEGPARDAYHKLSDILAGAEISYGPSCCDAGLCIEDATQGSKYCPRHVAQNERKVS